MRASIVFLAAFIAFTYSLPVEDVINPGYFLYLRPDGLIQVEYLNGTAETVFATEDTITFYFSTQSNRQGVKINESHLAEISSLTGWDNKKSTLVIVHGWNNNYESPVNQAIKTAALQAHDINVIVVDWSPIADKRYVTAQAAALKVGNYIGQFLLRMESVLNLDLSTVTVVGWSLGAHVAGNTGAAVGGRIGVVIGLDPTDILFSEKNIKNRLDPTDARFVQAIHTNDGSLGFGIIMGHADYYLNGGKKQPGCGFDVTNNCAHGRAFEYYAESLINDNFWARVCGSLEDYNSGVCSTNPASQMGGIPLSKARGKFFLTTNNASPYAKGLQ